ncbi:MAG: hypothetical protein JJ920_11835 [Roseitalea sp.]|jgi:DNA-binding transcriptional regulator LsrR (DeoR family)|nr:hypothetical protein [Roseitalea sp.]MBO6722938.1 hypothetical protein [Roseitalea sp.]MBO6743596.1 hypothetical protein [Roseitalea sp.]
MKPEAPSRHSVHDKDSLLSNIALLYYSEGLTQSEIAKRVGLSRATIVNMLREGRERGVVEIRVDGRKLASSNLSRMLCAKFGLEDAYVSLNRDLPGRKADAGEARALLSRVGAIAILDVAAAGDTIGVAWGATIKAVSQVMPRSALSDVTVCQLIGSMVSERVHTSEDCAIRIANQIGAICYTLHAPAVLSSVELANALMSEPTIREQLARLETLDLAIFSAGDTAPDTHLVAAGIATERQMAQAADQGAVAIICGRFVDRQGRQVHAPPDDRLIAITIDQLRRAKKKLLIAGGAERREAVLASIRGDLVTHLCVDEKLARRLLDDAG